MLTSNKRKSGRICVPDNVLPCTRLQNQGRESTCEIHRFCSVPRERSVPLNRPGGWANWTQVCRCYPVGLLWNMLESGTYHALAVRSTCLRDWIYIVAPKLRMKTLPPRAENWKIVGSDSVLSSWGECTVHHRPVLPPLLW